VNEEDDDPVRSLLRRLLARRPETSIEVLAEIEASYLKEWGGKRVYMTKTPRKPRQDRRGERG